MSKWLEDIYFQICGAFSEYLNFTLLNFVMATNFISNIKKKYPEKLIYDYFWF